MAQFTNKEKVLINDIEFSYNDYYKRLESDDNRFGVACPKCLGLQFNLSYGNYEVTAHCKCGNSMTVYDG